MKKFSIYYNSPFCKLNAFNRVEHFLSYDDAYDWCVTKNIFRVAYPEFIKITETK